MDQKRVGNCFYLKIVILLSPAHLPLKTKLGYSSNVFSVKFGFSSLISVTKIHRHSGHRALFHFRHPLLPSVIPAMWKTVYPSCTHSHTDPHAHGLSRPQKCHSRDSLIHHSCSYAFRHVKTETLTHGAHARYAYMSTCRHPSLPAFMSFQQLYPSLTLFTFRRRRTSR